jgi:type I restriction enzyme S subunit
MVDSPLGKIPEGWQIEKLGKICKIIPSYAFKSKDWVDSGIPVIKIKNISSDNMVNIEDIDYVSKDLLNPNLEKFTLNDGDMLVAMTGATAGKVGKVRTKEPLLLNQRVAKIAPDQQYKAYVWCLISLKDTQEKFYRLADGAAQPNMSGGQIENFIILLPPDPMCQKFSSITCGRDVVD